ncbi:MAG TPA: GAF domain-containing protein [Nocardioidaceae bacterium]|nr:GAF domain-containing protein [Nocardioidaceae bacterium]
MTATSTEPKARALLAAVIAISTDLDLKSVLTRIVESAMELTDATYGALGVIGNNGGLVEFITSGIDSHTHELIGDLPSGRGILRLLIDEPAVIRLDDLADHPQSFGFPPNHPKMASFLGVPIRIRGTAFGNLYLTEKMGGGSFTEDDEALVEGLAAAAGFVIYNARAYGLSERRRRWLEASAELTESLQPPIDFSRALQQVASTARRISGGAMTALVRFPADEDPVIIAGADGDAIEAIEPVLEDIRSIALLGTDGLPVAELPLRDHTAVAIPLRAHLSDLTVLVALFDKGHPPLEVGDREMLVSFGDQAGLALDRAQAVEDRAELAVVTERHRIARDLHDVVIQRLFSTGLQLQGLRAEAPSPEMAEHIDRAADDLDVTIKEIRSTIFALRQQGTPAS